MWDLSIDRRRSLGDMGSYSHFPSFSEGAGQWRPVGKKQRTRSLDAEERLVRAETHIELLEVEAGKDRDRIIELRAQVLELESLLKDIDDKKAKKRKGLRGMLYKSGRWFERVTRFASPHTPAKEEVGVALEEPLFEKIFEQDAQQIDFNNRNPPSGANSQAGLQAAEKKDEEELAMISHHDGTVPTPFQHLLADYDPLLVLRDQALDADHFARNFKSLFNSVEKYARMYTQPPANWAQEFHFMSKEFEADLGFGRQDPYTHMLMGNKDYRIAVIAKVMCTFISKSVFRMEVLFGHTENIDKDIARTSTLLLTGPHSPRRDSMFGVRALHVVRLRNSINYENFYNKRMAENAIALYDHMHPFIIAGSDAWQDLCKIITASHVLSMQMLSGPYEFILEHKPFNVPFEDEVSRAITVKFAPEVRFRGIDLRLPVQLSGIGCS